MGLIRPRKRSIANTNPYIVAAAEGGFLNALMEPALAGPSDAQLYGDLVVESQET